MSKYNIEIESHLEDIISFEPDRFKVWRYPDGSLEEVYDLELHGLWKRTNVGWIWLSNSHLNLYNNRSWSEDGLKIPNIKAYRELEKINE